MSDIKIEIDGKTCSAEPGAMVIEVADKEGINIPRFCYHKKLSIAANCRMCLVEVEKAPKPLPACATPVTDGMKIYTKSAKAVAAQRSVMEFLLINHPLDCPICDQGGECELQDVSMGYGEGISRYTQGKRSVDDKDLGPLIQSEMTRCIHCTRCVRFGAEIAGVQEMGGTNRGEHTEIGTYVSQCLSSELSGNIIDICPVGALTSKPYRYRARDWELRQMPSIAPHDCVGSHVNVHTRRDKVMRVIPRECEDINQTWISDRDRFSYEGLASKDRVGVPMVKRNNQWQRVDWSTALNFAVDGLRSAIDSNGADNVAAVAHPSSTLEEFYLLQKLMRGAGVHNIDHRVHQSDFSDQHIDKTMPYFDTSIEEIEAQQAILVVGGHLAKDQPMINHRVRMAHLADAFTGLIHDEAVEDHYTRNAQVITPMNEWASALVGVMLAVGMKPSELPNSLSGLADAPITDEHREIANALKQNTSALIIMGTAAVNGPNASLIRYLIKALAESTKSNWVELTQGANCAGARLAGMLPHRGPGGQLVKEAGYNALDALQKPLSAYVLMNLEPEQDCVYGEQAISRLLEAEFVVSLSPFMSEQMQQYANVILPIAPFTETSGTYVNCEGKWQTFTGAVSPLDEARPGWKVLRVLGNLMHVDGFDYVSSEDVMTECQQQQDKAAANLPNEFEPVSKGPSSNGAKTRWSIYTVDALVRRSAPLQAVDEHLNNSDS